MSGRALASDERGSLYLEYLLITFFVALFMMWFFVPETGSAMIKEYAARRNVLYATIP